MGTMRRTVAALLLAMSMLAATVVFTAGPAAGQELYGCINSQAQCYKNSYKQQKQNLPCRYTWWYDAWRGTVTYRVICYV